MEISVDDFSSDHVLSHWGRLVVAVWRGKTVLRAVRRREHLIRQLASELEAPVWLLTIIEPSAPLPAADVRQELAEFHKRAAGKIARSALVFEGHGFRAASVRAVVAGISLSSRPAYPHRFFGSVGAAARFLSGTESEVVAPHLLVRAAHEARRDAAARAFVPWANADPTRPSPSLRDR
jgi:hypothetical protein